MENVLLFMGGDFEFYSLLLLVTSVEMAILPQNFNVFPNVDEGSVHFASGDEISEYFSHIFQLNDMEMLFTVVILPDGGAVVGQGMLHVSAQFSFIHV